MTYASHPLVRNKARGEQFDVYVGRPSSFGNYFVIGRDGTREEVIAKFEARLRSMPAAMAKVKRELKGKTLGCWCSPLPCHADVLARIANDEE